MKNQNLDFNYDTFDDRKFTRKFKRVAERSIIHGKMYITGNIKEAKNNYSIIYKLINSIVRNPIVFQNDLIFITIIEITAFMDFIDGFIESIKGANSIDGWKMIQEQLFEKQKLLITHLRELSENPTKMPSFIEKK